MPNEELLVKESEEFTDRPAYTSFADILKDYDKWDDDKSEAPPQPEENFDFFSISKIVLVLLTTCSDTFNAFSSIFSVPVFEISAQKSEQQQSQKSTGLLTNLLTFFKNLSGSKPQSKNTESTTNHNL